MCAAHTHDVVESIRCVILQKHLCQSKIELVELATRASNRRVMLGFTLLPNSNTTLIYYKSGCMHKSKVRVL